MVSPKVKYKI